MDPNSPVQEPANGPLRPSYIGHVHDTGSALCLMEAALQGYIPHCMRRLHRKEQNQCIRSGHVFIYEEDASGVKRWTDGRSWSPSRIVGNFLVYREVNPPADVTPVKKKGGKGGKKKEEKKNEPRPAVESTNKSKRTARDISQLGYAIGPIETATEAATEAATDAAAEAAAEAATVARTGARANRDLVLPGGKILPFDGQFGGQKLLGSLTDTYNFKLDGLIKRTMSFWIKGKHHHMVSYMSLIDYVSGTFKLVEQDAMINHCFPREALLNQPVWRTPYTLDLGAFLPQHKATWTAAVQQHHQQHAQQHALQHAHQHDYQHEYQHNHQDDYQHDHQHDHQGLAMGPDQQALVPAFHPHHGLLHNGMPMYADQPHGMAINDYPVHDQYHEFVPEYHQGAYALAGEEQPGDVNDQAPRTSMVYHSPDIPYAPQNMAYVPQDVAYPEHNGAYSAPNVACEGEDMAYSEQDLGLQGHYHLPGAAGVYPPL